MDSRPADVPRVLARLRLRRSRTLDIVLRFFKDNPDSSFRAVDLLNELDLLPGSLHPVLDKLVAGGIIAVDREGSGPPPSTFKTYRLTEPGALFGDRYFAASRVPAGR